MVKLRFRAAQMVAAVATVALVGGCGLAAPTRLAAAPVPLATSAPPVSADLAPALIPADRADPGAKGWSRRLDQALAELVAMPGGPPGVLAVVQVGRHRTFHSAGVADVSTRARPTINDSMRIASVSKAFSGAAALALVDQKRLSLDDTIASRLPGLPAAWGPVTLRQLLSHTSGLADVSRSPDFIRAVQASPDQAPPPEQLIRLLTKPPLEFPPGTQYAYSNTDNMVVALMIQSVTGRSYDRVLSKEVLRPLKLTRTSLPAGIAMSAPVLRGYDLSDSGAPEDATDDLAGGWAWASGGVVSTPADLNTFIRGYVRGDLYRARTRAQQQRLFIPAAQSSPPGPGENAASLALFRYRTPCGTVYGHTGNTSGYTQFAVASSDGRRSVVVAMTLQRTDTSSGQDLAVFHALQVAEQAGVCTALRK